MHSVVSLWFFLREESLLASSLLVNSKASEDSSNKKVQFWTSGWFMQPRKLIMGQMLADITFIFNAGGDVPNILHQVSVPIMNNTKCQKMFTKSGHKKTVRNSFLCAGYDEGKKDSCEVFIIYYI